MVISWSKSTCHVIDALYSRKPGAYSEEIYESKKDFLQENCFFALILVDICIEKIASLVNTYIESGGQKRVNSNRKHRK